MKKPVAVVILAAGWGTRMRASLPKVLHEVAGKTLLGWVMDALNFLKAEKRIIVTRPEMTSVPNYAKDYDISYQNHYEGTGAAVMAAREELKNFNGTILIVFGDTPFISSETFQHLVEKNQASDTPSITLMGFHAELPNEYGRLIVKNNHIVEKIVETSQATAEQKKITLCNSGVMAIDSQILFDLLDKVTPNNTKNEYYLTDIILQARQKNISCTYIIADQRELLGINSKADLAQAENLVQTILRQKAMDQGVTLRDPSTIYLTADTFFGQDVVIDPYVVMKGKVILENNVTVHSFSHLDNAHIHAYGQIGPFARLRPNSNIGPEGKVGSFVEVKNTQTHQNVKINHLSYIGDTIIEENVTVGAGAITCNYNGYEKNKCTIKKDAFIGSNTSLIAPVTIGAGSIIGAGSVISKNVPEDSLAIARAPQNHKALWAKKFHENKRKK